MKKFAIVSACCLFFIGITLSSALAADTINVGVLLPLTGKMAKFGRIEQKSFLMAVNEINAAGGVNGKKIELIIADTSGKPDVGRSAIEKLITRDKVPVIAGGYSNSATWATIAVAQQNKVPFLVNTASADKITEQEWNYIFRLNQPASERLDAVASFVSAVAGDIKSVAIVYANSLKHSADARKFFKKAAELGLKPVIRERFEAGVDDFRPLLTRVKAKNPDLIYAVADNAKGAALLMRQSKELNLNPKLFVGDAAGFTLPEFEKNAGKASEYVYSATLWNPSAPYPGAKEYYEKFLVKYNTRTEYHGAQAYAAVYVIAAALRRTKSPTSKSVRNALAATDMMTVFGPVKFISYGTKTQQNRLSTFLVQWIDGKLEIIWPQNMATQKYIYPTPKWNNR